MTVAAGSISPQDQSDILELNRLAYRYAAAVDAFDVEAFVGVFTPDGRLRTYHPDEDEPFNDLRGTEKLALVSRSMRQMYRKTAHLMTNHMVELDGDTATGTVLCTARHLHADPTDDNALIVVIRYVDRYQRLDGAWRIADRQIRFLWSERHDVVDDGMGRDR